MLYLQPRPVCLSSLDSLSALTRVKRELTEISGRVLITAEIRDITEMEPLNGGYERRGTVCQAF